MLAILMDFIYIHIELVLKIRDFNSFRLKVNAKSLFVLICFCICKFYNIDIILIVIYSDKRQIFLYFHIRT